MAAGRTALGNPEELNLYLAPSCRLLSVALLLETCENR